MGYRGLICVEQAFSFWTGRMGSKYSTARHRSCRCTCFPPSSSPPARLGWGWFALHGFGRVSLRGTDIHATLWIWCVVVWQAKPPYICMAPRLFRRLLALHAVLCCVACVGGEVNLSAGSALASGFRLPASPVCSPV